MGRFNELFACRLCWRVTLAVFALILAIESVILIPSAQRFEQNALAQLADAAMVAVESALAIDEAAGRNPSRDLELLIGRHELVAVALYEKDGSIIAAAGPEAGELHYPGAAAGAGTRQRTRDGARFDVTWRSASGANPLVVTRLSSAHVRDALIAYTLRIAGLVALIVLVVTAGTMFVLHVLVLRPVLALRDSSTRAGALPDQADSFIVRTRRSDEIGELFAAFNAMLLQVAESKRRDRELSEERASFLTRHDALTGLPNRTSLIEHLEHLSSGEKRHQPIALHLVNIVQFKEVNSSIGVPRGDEMLKTLAVRLQRCAESGDYVAHLGADRFAVVQVGAQGANEAAAYAERLVHTAGEPYDQLDQKVEVSVRIGIAQTDAPVREPQALLGQAELALSRSSDSEGYRYQFYSPELAQEARNRHALKRDLEQALARGELYLAFQPKVRIDAEGARTLTGAEVLLRWTHPIRGAISPAQFIPIAEETGLIVPIGDFVLQATCRRAAEWLARYGWSPRLAVNLSARQFALPDLERRLERALTESRVPAELLEVEVTETAAMHNVESTARTLAALRSLGVRVSIDDFGTGYSSLNYLRRFAVDAIKIDKSFVDDIGADRSAEAVCDAILRLGQSLGTKVIAEGVENESQLAFLRRRRCDEAQGYLFGKPLAATEFERSWLVARAAA